MKFTPFSYRIFITLAVLLVIAAPTLVFAADDNGSWVGTTLAGFGASIFGLVGVLFDKALGFLVFDIGSHMQTAIGYNVQLIWSIVRDLCNLIFIFMFLFLGIRLVLTIENVGTAQKIIARVIIAALLINFSLFVSKAIIDVSNVATVSVYNMFISQSTLVGPLPDNAYPVSVGTQIAGQLGVQTWFSGATTETTAKVANKGFAIGLIMMFFFLLAAVTFLVATIMLIKRYIVLLLGMMFSPLVLLFSILPKGIPFTGSFSKKTEDGFHMFIQSAFFPAVFLFIIYIALLILKSYSAVPNFNGMLSDNSSSLPDIIVYCIGIGFLFLAMKSASMVSESMASGAMDMSRKAMGAATFGAAALVGRQTVARAARAMSEGSVGNAIRSSGLNKYKFGRALTTAAIGGLETARKGSYEIRSTGAYKSAGSTLGVPTGNGWGIKGGGFEERRDSAVAEEKKLVEQQAAVLRDPKLVAERTQASKDAEDAAKKAREKVETLRQEHRDAEKLYGPDSDEAKKARDTWIMARVDAKKAGDVAKTAKDALKEAETQVLVGTREARTTITQADTAAKYQAADSRLGEILREHERLAAQYADAQPEERGVLQRRMSALESEATGLRDVITKARTAAGEMAKAPQRQAVAAAEARIAGAQSALAGIGQNSNPELQKKLEDELVAAQQAKKAAESAAAAGPSIEDVATAIRSAQKTARVTRAKQGGIAGSMETGITNRAREAAARVAGQVLDPNSAIGKVAGVDKLPADVRSTLQGAVEDLGTSTEKAAGQAIRKDTR